MPLKTRHLRIHCLVILLSAVMACGASAQIADHHRAHENSRNRPERLEWLQDAGFGMFIHFSMDSQLGVVISHSLVGASEDYTNRFIQELPKTFNPEDFDPDRIATTAKLAGMKYVVFTAKHHSGFCMWDTQTTDFNIMNTPYGKDMVRAYVEAVRRAGLQVGLYFSPEDFLYLIENGQLARRRFPEPIPEEIMVGYRDLIRRQMTELMTQYGPIDVIFLDGGTGDLVEVCKDVCWDLQPDTLITRGAIATPEQGLALTALSEPWEACVTMGTQWQYKPTNETYKSGGRLIQMLIEARAKGGTLLLNVGPKPSGELPEAQEDRLMEMAAWYFINHEAVDAVRPWILTNENDIWFTRAKENGTVYAILTEMPDWPRGERREFVLQSVKATSDTRISVLGQSDKVVEYQPNTDATSRFEQTDAGLMISIVRAQRIYNDHRWPNPIVVKLENVQPAPISQPGVEMREPRVQ